MLPHRSHASLTSARDAATAFIAGTTTSWGRRELAKWLLCQYAPCVVPARGERFLRDAIVGNGGPPVLSAIRILEETAVEEIIRDARYRALRFLSEIATDRAHAEAIGRLMIATSAVLPVRDERGAIAYVPMDQAKMRLADRVMSLFVADYLNSPLDYRGVRVCQACGEIAFATNGLHQGAPHENAPCASIRRDSHIAGLELEPPERDARLGA